MGLFLTLVDCRYWKCLRFILPLISEGRNDGSACLAPSKADRSPGCVKRKLIRVFKNYYYYIIYIYIYKYTLWLFNSSPWYRWPIEIDGLPIKHCDFM